MPKKTPVPYPIRSRASEKNNTKNNSQQTQTMASNNVGNNDTADTEQDSATQFRLLRELITKVESSINNKLDMAVGEIRDDVSQIKVQLDNYNDSLTEVQERISSVEDKVEKLDGVGTELSKFKADWDTKLTEIDKEACRARKNNVIIKGIKGGSKEPGVALTNFNLFCKEELKMSDDWIKEVDVNELYHFPSKDKKGPWPLFVSLAKSRHREDMYKAAPNLKGKDFSLRNDLAPCLLKIRKELIAESTILRKDPHNCDTRLRDSPFEVWMIYKKQNGTKWLTWKGWKKYNDNVE